MWKRCLIQPCLAVLLAAAFPALLKGQARNAENNPSHIEVPIHPPADGQFADFLKSRDHAHEGKETREKLQELIKNKRFQELIKGLDEDTKKRIFEGMFDKNGQPR